MDGTKAAVNVSTFPVSVSAPFRPPEYVQHQRCAMNSYSQPFIWRQGPQWGLFSGVWGATACLKTEFRARTAPTRAVPLPIPI